MNVPVPWAAWYANTRFVMEFPDHWDIHVTNIHGQWDLRVLEIEKAICHPWTPGL